MKAAWVRFDRPFVGTPFQAGQMAGWSFAPLTWTVRPPVEYRDLLDIRISPSKSGIAIGRGIQRAQVGTAPSCTLPTAAGAPSPLNPR
jgi:hypothetical protein